MIISNFFFIVIFFRLMSFIFKKTGNPGKGCMITSDFLSREGFFGRFAEKTFQNIQLSGIDIVLKK